MSVYDSLSSKITEISRKNTKMPQKKKLHLDDLEQKLFFPLELSRYDNIFKKKNLHIATAFSIPTNAAPVIS